MTQIYSFPCSLNWISIIYISLNNSDKYIQKFTCYNPIIYFSYCSLRLNQRKLIKSVLTGNQSLKPSLLRSQSHNLYAPSICLVIYLTLLHSEKHQHIWQKSSMYVYLILCWLYSLRNFFFFLFLFFFLFTLKHANCYQHELLTFCGQHHEWLCLFLPWEFGGIVLPLNWEHW